MNETHANETVTIGAGAGYASDRIAPAVELAKYGDLDYLVFECLAERTIANAQLRKRQGSDEGYTPLLPRRMEAVLPHCKEQDIDIITNMGAANPTAAREQVIETVTELGIADLSIASITGADVTDQFEEFHEETLSGEPVKKYKEECVSANAYLGVEGIIDALEEGADVMITGRVADPSLYLAPLLYEYDLDLDDPSDVDFVGQAIACGHLMECAGQVTGGYFADPGYKDVDGLADLGFPIAEVTERGEVQISKLPDTGGKVTTRTCKEQILYEIHDPSAYVTPDAIADFSDISFAEVGRDQVEVSGATADPKPNTLKVNIGYEDAILGEGQISYAGPGATDRAQLARDIVRQRLENKSMAINDLRIELLGVDSLHGERDIDYSDPYEVRLRAAGKCETRAEAAEIGREVQTLYTNGPAGGGGATIRTEPVLGIVSTLIDREGVQPTTTIEEVT